MTDPRSDAVLREVVIRLEETVKTLDRTVNRLVDKTVSTETHEALEKRVMSLESLVTWAGRLIGSAVILALLSLVLIQGGRP